jgi:hypothetical protein
MSMSDEQRMAMQTQPMARHARTAEMTHAGHLYIQTNEVGNAVVHYIRARMARSTSANGSDQRRRLGRVQTGQRTGEGAERVRGRS